MDENSDHPERKDRGQTPSSGIQTEIGRGRSPRSGAVRSSRPRPTEQHPNPAAGTDAKEEPVQTKSLQNEDEHPTATELEAIARIGGDGLNSSSGATYSTIMSSLFEETQDAPGSDSEIDTVPTNDDDQNSKDSQRDRDGKKGDRSGGEDKGKEDDNNQYNRFLTGDAITAQANFPVSENSVECARFNKSLEDLVIRLEQSDTEWVSIDCLGRRWISESKEAKIRTTVVVSFSQYPDRAEELRRDLQRAMKDNKLPIEFIRGRVARYVANLFGLREPQAPLVCGSSCAPHGVEGAGTVGGFITIEGDPDRDAVYAVTNHHVIAEDNKDKEKIPWTTGKGKVSHPGLSEQHESLAALRLAPYDWRGIHAILTRPDSLKPTPKRYHGDCKSYAIDLAKQVLNHWKERYPDDQIDQKEPRIMNSISKKLSQFNVSKKKNRHDQEYRSVINSQGLGDFENLILEDIRASLNRDHCYELQIPLRAVNELSGTRGDGMTLFKDVIRIRQLRREPLRLSRIIEHPAKKDLEYAIQSVKELLHPPDGEPPVLQADAERLRQKLRTFKNHKKSANKLIGTVWASSGLESHQRRQDDSLPFEDDWALIKLFRSDDQTHRNNAQEFENSFSANLLRPDFPKQRFTGVMGLSTPKRIDVTKRGRTTDLTAGVVNGAASIINEGRGPAWTFAIVSKPPIRQFFSTNGDSGSWIMDRAGKLVGMMWSGRTKLISERLEERLGDPGTLKAEDIVQVEEIVKPKEIFMREDIELEDLTYFTPDRHLFKWIEESFEKGMRGLGQKVKPSPRGGRVKLFG